MAVDVADHLVNRLFAAGLALHGALVAAESDEARQRIMTALDEIDAAISVIRMAAMGIDDPTGSGTDPGG